MEGACRDSRPTSTAFPCGSAATRMIRRAADTARPVVSHRGGRHRRTSKPPLPSVAVCRRVTAPRVRPVFSLQSRPPGLL